jgi:Flp pilus assembly pilin Flp
VARPNANSISFSLAFLNLFFGQRGSYLRREGMIHPQIWEPAMKFIKSAFIRVWRDEQGAGVVEYCLILGLLVVMAIGVLGQIGVKTVNLWKRVGVNY